MAENRNKKKETHGLTFSRPEMRGLPLKGRDKATAICPECGFHISGENHKEGSHHKTGKEGRTGPVRGRH